MTSLTPDELAREAEVDPALVEELVRIGVLHPSEDGRLSAGDIVRVETVQAGVDAGLTLEQLERARSERLMTLDHMHRFYLERAPRSGRTYAEFAASLGDRAALLPAVDAAFGLAEPGPNRHLRTDEEDVVAAFLDAWASVAARDVVIRVARMSGEGVRRIVEGTVGAYFDHVSLPVDHREFDLDEMVERVVEPATRVADIAPRLLVWLEQRHMEHALNAMNFDELERTMVERGWAAARPVEPPAIAFADLSGFTSMTEERGDALAARLAGRLQDLAETTARSTGGRVVKLLGDGAMVRFPGPGAAVTAMVDLVAGTAGAGLPPAHVGIHAGPIIERDGDVYGNTVNLAARIADAAGPGEILVSEAVREAIAATDVAIEPRGPLALKGVSMGVPVFRVLPATA